MATYLFMDAIYNNRPLTIFNNSEMVRDFTYVDDIAKVVDLLLNKYQWANKKGLQILNVGNQTAVPLSIYV